MPTYQYACTAAECGNRFERVQSFTDPAASECPVCTGPVRKVYSAVGVVFKGSGFYRTDSRESARKAKAGSSSAKSDSTAGSSDASPSSSSESKSSSAESSSSTSSSSDKSSGSGSSGGSSAGSSAKPATTAAKSGAA